MCLIGIGEINCSCSSHAIVKSPLVATATSLAAANHCLHSDVTTVSTSAADAMSKVIPVAAAAAGEGYCEHHDKAHVHHSAAIAVPKAHALDVNDCPISAHAQASNDMCINIEFGPMNDKYRIVELVNRGSFGRVYSGVRVNTNEEVAIKAEDQGSGHEKIMKEANLCRKLEGCAGIPQLYWYGMHGSEYNFMVMERLGPNLLELFEQCGRKFSLTTVLKVLMSVLPTLRHIHEKNIMHRDLSPRNIVIGRGDRKCQIYLIDLGLAKQCTRQGQMLLPSPTRYGGYCHPLVGTPRYASINSHRGNVIGRTDDLESLGYVLVYLLKGALPWQDEINDNMPETIRYIEHQKVVTPIEELCEGVPDEFATLISYARLLRYYEMPDYKSIATLFRHLIDSAGIDMDAPFDWERPARASVDEADDELSQVSTRLKRNKASLPRIQCGSEESMAQFTCSLCSTNTHSLCKSN